MTKLTKINRNRMGNISNRYQTDTKKVLTVCSAGMLRSPTLANVLYEEYGYNCRAVGATPEFALIPIDMVLVAWADEIVFVEQDVYNTFKFFNEKINIDEDKVTILDVPDLYEWNYIELKSILLAQYKNT